MGSLEKCSVQCKEDFLTLLLKLESALYYDGGTEGVKSYVEYIFIFLSSFSTKRKTGLTR